MSEHRRKTLRSFYCEEQLWQAFDRAARESDSTIDQLLNDALRQYLGQGAAPSAPAMPPAPAPVMRPPTAQIPAVQPPSEHPTFSMPAVPRKPAVPPRPTGAMAPVPPPAPVAPPRPATGGMPSLFVHYEGRSYPVNKDNFIIGRGTQGTDLTIRDQNVSRKHASVILHGGAFYIQDLGSTNGVEFRGGRVDSRKIEEGDVYTICDHEIVFSFRG